MRMAGAMRAEQMVTGVEGRPVWPVRTVLEWAFGVEFASFDDDEIGSVGPAGFAAISMTALIGDQLALGDEPGVGVRVDTSRGRSWPHDDADVVASIVRACLPGHRARIVAEHARCMTVPVWDLGPVQCVVRRWKAANGHGRCAATEALPPETYRGKRGRAVRYTPVICPVDFAPTGAQRAAAYRAYKQWVADLQHVAVALKTVSFQKFDLAPGLPPLSPWKKGD